MEKEVISMKFHKTEDQVTDIITKALHREQFVKNMLRLSLIEMTCYSGLNSSILVYDKEAGILVLNLCNWSNPVHTFAGINAW